jgi:tetratricopeptide (TPR) repeat protein
VPRQAYTSDQGRFEFPDIEPGGYRLTARSLTDPSLISDSIETDTSGTATNDLSVNLLFRRESVAGVRHAPSIVTVTEVDQKVSKDARKAFKKGLEFKRDDEPDKALKSFARAIELYPDYLQALAERGDLYVTQHKLTEAAEDFARALRIDARNGLALRGAGYCKLEKREFTGAAEDFERSISADPNNPNTYLLLGISYLELDRLDLAGPALRKAIDLGVVRAHIHLGNLYARGHQYGQAADELELFLKAEPLASDAAEMRAVEAQWRARATAP